MPASVFLEARSYFFVCKWPGLEEVCVGNPQEIPMKAMKRIWILAAVTFLIGRRFGPR